MNITKRIKTNITKLTNWFRDWRRGYTDADMFSMLDKLYENPTPGQPVKLTDKEMKAFRARGKFHMEKLKKGFPIL